MFNLFNKTVKSAEVLEQERIEREVAKLGKIMIVEKEWMSVRKGNTRNEKRLVSDPTYKNR